MEAWIILMSGRVYSFFFLFFFFFLIGWILLFIYGVVSHFYLRCWVYAPFSASRKSLRPRFRRYRPSCGSCKGNKYGQFLQEEQRMQIKAYGDVDLSSMSATPTGSDSNLSNPAAWYLKVSGSTAFSLDLVSASDEDDSVEEVSTEGS